MAKITDELTIRGNHIKNRIVMPPMVTFSFHGDNRAYFGKQHIEHNTTRAKGGTGLIIVQATSIFGAVDSTGVWTKGDIEALKQIVINCHEYNAKYSLRNNLIQFLYCTKTFSQASSSILVKNINVFLKLFRYDS